MNNRVKIVRAATGLTQPEFGSRLGITAAAVSKIESGDRTVTPQVSRAIYREFNVNPEWFETGRGEMFIEKDDNISSRIDEILSGEDSFRKNLFKAILTWDDNEIALLEKMMKDLIK